MLAMTGVLAATLVALVSTTIVATYATARRSVDDTLVREADAYGAAIAGAPNNQSLVEATRSYLSGRDPAKSGLEPLLVLALADGRTIANSEVALEDVPLPDKGFGDASVGTDSYRVLAVPVRARDGAAATFYAALSARIAGETVREVVTPLLTAGLIALALALPLSYLATRRALRPLVRMAADAEHIGSDPTVTSITYDGPDDELGVLAGALTHMLERLERAAADQRAFVADASHELRTPVAVIRGNSELLLSGTLSEGDARESLRQIELEARRMGRLLDELLGLARLEAGIRERFQPLSLPVALQEAAVRGRALGTRDIRVDAICDTWVMGQPDLIDQALANLVRNAVTHTSPGGRITLTCDESDGIARIHVTDDGPGVPASESERIFDRFHRAAGSSRDDATGGAGLGLTITRRLIELHGGSIRVEQAEPTGARFVIELPALTPSEASGSPLPAS